jgi:hypothetical protein
MLGKGYLCAVVTQDAWQTPTTNMDMVRSEEGVQKRIAFRASIGRKSIPDGNLGEQMQRVVKDAANWPTATATNRVRNEETLAKCAAFRKRNANQNTVPLYLEEVVLREEQHGQAAPASSSSLGSRQGLSWATPNTTDVGRMWKPETLERRKAEGKVAQMGLNYQAVKLWPTITAHTPDMESSGPNGHSGTYLAGAVKSWLTPKVPSGGSQAERTPTGKLNPRWVETLMGLPVGWVMPSCKSPVTIAPTNSDSSATESCLPPQSELFAF